MIIAMAGLPGSGKSTVAKAISAKLPALMLNKDVLRAALFPPIEIEYSTRQDDFVVDIMLQVANFYVEKDAARHIILDGRTFSKERQVNSVVQFAKAHAWDLQFISCTCSDQVAQVRIEHDVAVGKHLAANRNYAMYLKVKAQSEPLKVPHLSVDTEEPFDLCVMRCLEYVGGRSENLKNKEES